jgi:hypothetical protein
MKPNRITNVRYKKIKNNLPVPSPLERGWGEVKII